MTLLFLIILIGGAFAIAAIASQSTSVRRDRPDNPDRDPPKAD